MNTLSVAVVQFAPQSDTAENLKKIVDYAEEAVSVGADLILFPEYSSNFTPQFGKHTVDQSESIEGMFVTSLRQAAKRLSVFLVCGFVEKLADEANRCSNTVVAIDPAGEIVATYRKIHLYDAFGQKESDWVKPGGIGDPPTFTVGALTIGLQTCYDLRFPEITRWLVDAGADLVLIPAEWVSGELKTHHWQTLLAARAIENTIYVAAADHTPPIAVGHSSILDPRGVQLAVLAHDEGIVYAEVNAETVKDVRRLNPALALRRFGVHPKKDG